MIPTTYFDPAGTSPKFARAFSNGCGGALVPTETGVLPGPMAAFGNPPTWPLFDAAIADARDWYYGDHAFWGRGTYYRVARNAVQYQPTLADLAAATPTRYDRVAGPIVPWKRDGASIVICPNGVDYMRRFGLDAAQWGQDVEATLRQYTDRPMIHRWKADAKVRPLAEDLKTAWAVVVFSSNSAIEAIMAGVPSFTLCPWATSSALSLADLARIETPFYPDTRSPFLWSLADHQWTLDEIAAGAAWRCVRDHRDPADAPATPDGSCASV